ncbi:ATP-binding protein [Streptomyces californicus]|uniref:ATP-binding protein n=1 Tax=Streptomyces TaxID=1883 RepID=UPI0015C4CFC2|nr:MULTISPECIES: ATP-binding protein [Streptomyces]MBK0372988.1 ATP-binding protein [Streptomyces sp. RB110-1]MBK0390644.1 ATP-binding protein [Streptomyces sp. RB110-2]MCF3170859.1 ATP-binding protein [Streptomyces violaceoruber]MDW4897119.1 ATP-binding protein [Streptomyces californicus]QLG30486.1 ATP-binding protein [Streptomyces sp. CB04723]
MERLLVRGTLEQGCRETGATVVARDSAGYEMTSGEIARSRAFVRDFLADAHSRHGLEVSDRAADVAQLVVSELATNVCKYAPGPCLLDLEATEDSLDIVMWDSGAVLPAASPADPARVGRHGLELVLMVCQSFSVHREPVGKRVRVRISLRDDPSGDPAGSTVG